MKKSVLLFAIILSGLTCFSQLNGNVLKIRGNATLYQTPEIMYVNIPIQVIDSLYENCSKKLTQIHNELISRLISKGIKKTALKTDGLNIGEKTKWTREGRISDGFQGSISVKIEMKYSHEDLNAIINTLKSNSFNFGYNVDFGLSEEQKSNTLEKAIEFAIKDAERKAEIISKNMNLKLVEIKEINFGYSAGDFDLLTPESDYAFFVADDVEVSEGSVEININPKKIMITKTINIIWNIQK